MCNCWCHQADFDSIYKDYGCADCKPLCPHNINELIARTNRANDTTVIRSRT